MYSHLYEIVQRRAATIPSAVALGAQDGLVWTTITSQELLRRVDRLADELARRGVGDGDRVITWLPGHWRTPIFFWACWKLGAIVVPFDREMNPEAAERIIASVEPRRVLVGFGQRPAWAPDDLVEEWWDPGAEGIGTTSPDRWQQPTEELAAIYYTSGTTGAPKGCMISHANLLSQIDAAGDVIPLDPSCRLASVLPLSHLFELTCGLLYPIASGAAVHYVPSRRGPDILRVLNEQRITHMVVVPQLLTIMGHAIDSQLKAKVGERVHHRILQLAGALPFPARRVLFWPALRRLGGHLRLVAAGGAALYAETQLLWERMGVRVVQGYGTSECSPIVAGGRPDGSTPIGSVGKPLRGVTVRLSPDGELLVQGPNVMRGYWKDPQRTAEVLQDGWYATGDLARIDEAGNIFLAGRAKELIVLPSGLKVWPQDVEDVLREHPAVADAAVIGVPTPGGGMVLHAYLLPGGSGRDADISQIVAESNGRLAQHQRIATASWWTEPDFPRTTTLKVRRHLLPIPEAVQSVTVDSVTAADDPVGQAIAGVARVASVRDEQSLAELGLDSLAILDLGLALEDKTGKTVAEGDITTDMTVAQVRSMMAKAPPLGVGAAPATPRGDERTSANQPLWPYTWGRVFRRLRLPIDLAYRWYVTDTIVLGAEHLERLPPRLILAGTHHAYADFPLLYQALKGSPARQLADRLVVAARANAFDQAGLAGWLGILALGLYPLRQYGEQDVSLRGLARLAQQGNPVVIFPQGHHVEPADELRSDPSAAFKPGIGHLAVALDATVVPFGLAGTEKVLPNVEQGLIAVGDIVLDPRRGPLAIAFGPPIERGPAESPVELTRRLQEVCYQLTRQAEAALAGARTAGVASS